MTLMAELIALAAVAVMVVGAYQMGRIAERWRRWGDAFERLREFRFGSDND